MQPRVPDLRALFLLSVIAASASAASTAPAKTVPTQLRKTFLEVALGSGPRIVGGYDAAPGQFPYQVSVRSDDRTLWHGHFCGGSIINATTVVTAAHCMYNVPGNDIGKLYIVAGTNLLSSGGVKVYVKEKLVHPDYGPVYQDYDIALLFLSEPLPLNQDTIKTVRLQDVEGLPSGLACVASGWGRTVDSKTSPLPDKLQAVDVPIINVDSCAAYYEEEADYSPVIETQLCAGFEEGKKDACQGDSGGPLVCGGLLTGIVSWGSGCAVPRFPGVYSDVAFLLPWITENVVLNDDPDDGGSTKITDSTTQTSTGFAPGVSPSATLTLSVGLLTLAATVMLA